MANFPAVFGNLTGEDARLCCSDIFAAEPMSSPEVGGANRRATAKQISPGGRR
jgi:hypothetical protein